MLSYKNVVKAVSKRLNAHIEGSEFAKTKIVAADLSEPIIRPSIKIIIPRTKAARFNSKHLEKIMNVEIYYFAENREKPSIENGKMAELMNEALLGDLAISQDCTVAIDELDFDDVDGVLLCEFELRSLEEIEDKEQSEYMENIAFNIKE